MLYKIKGLAVNIGLPLVVGGISAYISSAGMKAFSAMKQPPLSPPAALFPIVWTVLYILMGIASYLVAHSDNDRNASDKALTVYLVQLGVNFFWSIFFFKFGWYLFSFLWLVLLWVLIAVTVMRFYKVSKTAAYLLVPYLLWVSFAGYLNLGVFILNR